MNNPDFGNSWQLHKFKHFEIVECKKSSYIVETGSSFQINGTILNNAEDIGTTYLVVKLANPTNQHEKILFDSDRDFSAGRKESLRFIDIKPKSKKKFSVNIPISDNYPRGTLDMRLELWSPGRLRYPDQSIDTVALFYRSFWGNGIDLISPEDLIAKAFVSYAQYSQKHTKWVNELAQELARRQIRAILDQRDLEFGQELTEFMEQVVDTPVCLVICSATYTEKANDRKGKGKGSGVQFEVNKIENELLKGRNKAQVIPIVRDNPSKEIPKFLNSAFYIDMDKKDWSTKPLTDLTNQIIKYNLST